MKRATHHWYCETKSKSKSNRIRTGALLVYYSFPSSFDSDWRLPLSVPPNGQRQATRFGIQSSAQCARGCDGASSRYFSSLDDCKSLSA